MSPAVRALVEHVESLEGPVSAQDFVKLKALAEGVRTQDPVRNAFDRAVAGFRKARS